VAPGVIRALFDRYPGLGERFISWVQPRQIGAPTLARTTAPARSPQGTETRSAAEIQGAVDVLSRAQGSHERFCWRPAVDILRLISCQGLQPEDGKG
jgi:hypothetical protein